MTSFCFFVQLADRTLILKQKELFVFITATRLLWNHSPSEWFLLQKGLDPVQSICRATTRKRPFAVWYAQVDSVSSRSPGWMVMPVS